MQIQELISIMKSRFICILCVSILLCGCSHNSSNVATYKITENYIDEIIVEDLFALADYITINTLEFNPLIGILTGTYITEKHIYVSDYNSIYVIDKTGLLIGTISRYGRSEQEYIGIADFCVQDRYIYT